MKDKLSVTEELDFHYLLALLTPLYNVPEYSWLPELFSIIGYNRLLTLSKYAGGEIIKIPTIDELELSMNALQWFLDVDIKKSKDENEVPLEYRDLFCKIRKVYNARNRKE